MENACLLYCCVYGSLGAFTDPPLMERMSAFSVCVIMDKSSPNLHEYIVSKLFDKCFVIPGSAGGGVHKTVPLPLKSPSFVTALPPRPPPLPPRWIRARHRIEQSVQGETCSVHFVQRNRARFHLVPARTDLHINPWICWIKSTSQVRVPE